MAYNFSKWFAENHLSEVNRVLYSTTFAFTILCLFWGIFCLPLTIIDKKLFHFNFRVLRFSIILSYFIYTIGVLMVAYSVLVEDSLKPIEHADLYFFGTLVLQVGTHLLRCLWVAIFIERATATLYSRSYEHGRFYYLSFILPILFCALAIALVIARFILLLNEFLIFAIRFSVDLAGCTILILIFKINKKKRKINDKSTVQLSDRYQITENIRVIKYVYPIMIIGVSTATLGSLLGIANKITPTVFNLYSYMQIVYFQVFLIHICISLVLWAKGNRLYSNKIHLFWKKINPQLQSTEPSYIQPVVLKNVEGVAINRIETIDEYFKQLNYMWR